MLETITVYITSHRSRFLTLIDGREFQEYLHMLGVWVQEQKQPMLIESNNLTISKDLLKK